MSETITVRSVLGRFLEHSRIFWFENSGDPDSPGPEVWIGSADLMHRNLDRRVEVLVSLPTTAAIDEVGRMLDVAFSDNTSAWCLGPDGVWTRRATDDSGVPLRDLQDWLIHLSRGRRRGTPITA